MHEISGRKSGQISFSGDSLLEPQEAHFGGDAVGGRADEEEPLGEEVADQDEVVAVWDGLDEFVPCEDEVGEYEEHCAEGEEAAALEHGGH